MEQEVNGSVVIGTVQFLSSEDGGGKYLKTFPFSLPFIPELTPPEVETGKPIYTLSANPRFRPQSNVRFLKAIFQQSVGIQFVHLIRNAAYYEQTNLFRNSYSLGPGSCTLSNPGICPRSNIRVEKAISWQ